MAGKGKNQAIPMIAKDESGKISYTYITFKNSTNKEKMELRKYNPRTRKHEKFTESKFKK